MSGPPIVNTVTSNVQPSVSFAPAYWPRNTEGTPKPFENKESFSKWCDDWSLDVDNITIKTKNPMVLFYLSRLNVTIGRISQNIKVPPRHTLIAHGPCYVSIPNEYKEEIADQIRVHLGIPLMLHNSSTRLFDCPSHRLSTGDLVRILKTIHVTDIHICTYGMKGTIESHQYLDSLRQIYPPPDTTIELDIGVEQCPTRSMRNNVPLVHVHFSSWSNVLPEFSNRVFRYFMPFQLGFTGISHSERGFGGLAATLRRNHGSAGNSWVNKIIVYPKIVHTFKFGTFADLRYLPKSFATLKNHAKVMDELLAMYENTPELNRVLRYEFRTQMRGSLQETVMQAVLTLEKLRPCLITFEAPLDLLLSLYKCLKIWYGEFFTGMRACKEPTSAMNFAYSVLMSCLGVYNSKYEKMFRENPELMIKLNDFVQDIGEMSAAGDIPLLFPTQEQWRALFSGDNSMHSADMYKIWGTNYTYRATLYDPTLTPPDVAVAPRIRPAIFESAVNYLRRLARQSRQDDIRMFEQHRRQQEQIEAYNMEQQRINNIRLQQQQERISSMSPFDTGDSDSDAEITNTDEDGIIAAEMEAEQNEIELIVQEVRFTAYRGRMRAMTKNGGTAKVGNTEREIAVGLIERFGDTWREKVLLNSEVTQRHEGNQN